MAEQQGAGSNLPAQHPIGDLTPREIEVLSRVARGLTNKEIGRVLSLSEKTVKHHMTSIMQKLHARNRMQAVLIASDMNLCDVAITNVGRHEQ